MEFSIIVFYFFLNPSLTLYPEFVYRDMCACKSKMFVYNFVIEYHEKKKAFLGLLPELF